MAIRRLRVRDRYVVFDENTLALYPGDANVAAGAAPQYALSRNSHHLARMVVLNVTHRCNLACHYCFVRNTYPRDLPRMTLETAMSALRLVQPGQGIKLSFFGGEPLLEWDTIVAVSEAAKAAVRHAVKPDGKRPPLHLHVTTNGTLLDADKIRYLAENGFSLIVSVDGPQDLHDAARPFADGSGSFDAVMRGLEHVRQHPRLAKSTTLRGTFTAANVQLLRRVEFLNRLVDEGFAGGVSVEPASLATERVTTRLADPEKHEFRMDHMHALRDEYEAVADWMLEGIRAGHKPIFMHFDKITGRLLSRRGSPSDCGAGWGYLTLGPGGKVYPCHRESEPIGRITRRGLELDEGARAQWMDNRWYTHVDCPTCWARNLCGGGCRMDALEATGDIHRQNPVACQIRKFWFLNAMHMVDTLGREESLKAWNVKPKKNSASSSSGRPGASGTCSCVFPSPATGTTGAAVSSSSPSPATPTS